MYLIKYINNKIVTWKDYILYVPICVLMDEVNLHDSSKSFYHSPCSICKLNVCSTWRIVRLEVDTFLSIHFGYVHNVIHSSVENLNVTSILWNNLIKIILGSSGSSSLLFLQTIRGSWYFESSGVKWISHIFINNLVILWTETENMHPWWSILHEGLVDSSDYLFCIFKLFFVNELICRLLMTM